MKNVYLNVGFRFVTKTFVNAEGKTIEYEQLEIVLDEGLVITANVSREDVNFFKWYLKYKEEIKNG
jgi:hypothetical protein